METPLQSKIDVSALPPRAGGGLRDRPGRDRRGARLRDRRACCRTSSAPTPSCRSWSPTTRPCTTRWRRSLEKLGEGGKYNKQEKEQYKLETDRILQDAEFWRKVGRGVPEPAHRHRPRGLRGAEPLRLPVRGARGARSRHQPPAAGARQPLPRAQGLQPHRRLLLRGRPHRRRPCTRRSSPRRSSTARSRRSRPCRRISS